MDQSHSHRVGVEDRELAEHLLGIILQPLTVWAVGSPHFQRNRGFLLDFTTRPVGGDELCFWNHWKPNTRSRVNRLRTEEAEGWWLRTRGEEWWTRLLDFTRTETR